MMKDIRNIMSVKPRKKDFTIEEKQKFVIILLRRVHTLYIDKKF